MPLPAAIPIVVGIGKVLSFIFRVSSTPPATFALAGFAVHAAASDAEADTPPSPPAPEPAPPAYTTGSSFGGGGFTTGRRF